MRKFVSGLLMMVLLIAGLVGCAGKKAEDDKWVEGKWKKVAEGPKTYVVEFTSMKEWKYYIDGEMVEEGTFVIQGSDFILKHKVEEHHDHGDGQEHTHETPPDHVYKYSVSADKKELKLTHGEKTSVYNKL